MGHAGDAPTLASTLNHSAFNLGNALGAWVGAAALSYGQPIAHLPWTCMGLSAVALVIAGVSAKMGGGTLPKNASLAHGLHG
jgi:DHA1 family inner membrane transport protein